MTVNSPRAQIQLRIGKYILFIITKLYVALNIHNWLLQLFLFLYMRIILNRNTKPIFDGQCQGHKVIRAIFDVWNSKQEK